MITVPAWAWDQLLDAFSTAPRHHERVAYLDGIRVGNVGVVTTVTVPDAETSAAHYTVAAAAMSEAGAHFRLHGLVRLAQVHTHGGRHVDHSDRDDRMSYSKRVGAVSLVLPYHGYDRPLPTDPSVGVHVRRDAGWLRVDAEDATQVLAVVPSFLDHRSAPCETPVQPTGIVATLVAWSRWIRTRLL